MLAAAFYRIRRYDEFLSNLDISTSVLADRLNAMVGHGILEKRRYRTRPERFEYVLTNAAWRFTRSCSLSSPGASAGYARKKQRQ
ncbi:MAG: helix-turn-helix transcriptional regulator [Oceanicaulis sp.]|nr:helix-turn-helix transcriptional regulator [Oceanicaulis sp.]